MNELVEIWKPVMGYEGFYEISNLGRVRSLDRWRNAKNGSKSILKGKVMKNHYVDNGYIRILLNDGIEKKKHLIHRLVAKAFIPNPNNLPEVNHKDEDKSNNIVWINEDGSIDYNKSNLEWCDDKYNTRYSLAKPIIQFTLDGELVKKWDATIDIENELHINHSAVSGCCKNKYGHKSAGGFIWKYYEGFFLGDMIYTLKTRVA